VWAVEIVLDPTSEGRVRYIWDALDESGVTSLGSVPGTAYRPHISLAVCEDGDRDQVGAALTAVLRPCIGTPLTLASLGFFLGTEHVAFLGATPTDRLLGVHRRVHAALDGVAANSWPLYAPGSFVPHCTLAMGWDDAAPIVAAVAGHALPIEAVAHEVHLVEISTGRSLGQLA
jgi:2'-5' RNA ligase